MLKLKEISKKQIIADVRSPLVKTTKKVSSTRKRKSSELKKSARSSMFLEPT